MERPVAMKIVKVLPAALALILLAACGSLSVSKDAISGVYAVTLTKAALSDAGAGFALATSFDKAALVLELTPDGVYRIGRLTDVGRSSLGEGTYDLTAAELRFGPDTGELGCSAIGVNDGSYGWKAQNDTLVLSLIADECDDRAYPLTALPWSRTALPFSMAP
jgi:hypothetical protein